LFWKYNNLNRFTSLQFNRVSMSSSTRNWFEFKTATRITFISILWIVRAASSPLETAISLYIRSMSDILNWFPRVGDMWLEKKNLVKVTSTWRGDLVEFSRGSPSSHFFIYLFSFHTSFPVTGSCPDFFFNFPGSRRSGTLWVPKAE